MKKGTQLTVVLSLAFVFAACSNSKKEGNAVITDKKAKLEKLKITKTNTEAEIAKLEEEFRRFRAQQRHKPADNDNVEPAGTKKLKSGA